MPNNPKITLEKVRVAESICGNKLINVPTKPQPIVAKITYIIPLVTLNYPTKKSPDWRFVGQFTWVNS
jgi:hypothetical protein